jgi:hypothetical protein
MILRALKAVGVTLGIPLLAIFLAALLIVGTVIVSFLAMRLIVPIGGC